MARVAETPDVTLAELREALWRERGLRVAVSTLWRFFDRHRITLKKTYGPPRLQADFLDPAVSVCANVSGIGALLPAQMEFRATRSSQDSRRQSAIF
jgi:hypothetical protein